MSDLPYVSCLAACDAYVPLSGQGALLVWPLLPEESGVVLLGLRFGGGYSFSGFLYMRVPPVQSFGFVYC